MTYIAQPADQSWMAPFKSLYFKKWNHWLVHAPKAFTPAGNMQSPGYARVVDWISEAWAELDSNMIASSFQRCGITSRNFADYSHQLRHFMRTTELVDDVMPQADLVHDENVFAAIGDEWEEQEEALNDSDSEIELNKKKFLIFLIYFLFFTIPPIWFIK